MVHLQSSCLSMQLAQCQPSFLGIGGGSLSVCVARIKLSLLAFDDCLLAPHFLSYQTEVLLQI